MKVAPSLIYKGYRIEKRLVPLDGQPLRVPCGKCPEIFSDDDAKEAHENLRRITFDFIRLFLLFSPEFLIRP
jgi:hypothetical protein